MAKKPNRKTVYLDYAAATPLSPSVKKVMDQYSSEKFFNPSAQYLAAQEVAVQIDEFRAKVAQTLGVKKGEIIFTAGGTEANNLAIHGVMQQFKDAEMLISSVEHESVREPAKVYAAKEIPVQKDGRINLEKLEKQITEKTVLVSVMLANNEIGTVQPIRQVAKIIEQEREARRKSGNKLPIYLHSDAAQAGNYLDLHTARLGVDLMTLNGGKIYGPKQSGVLFVKAKTVLKPQILGGGQEHGMRSGTENVAGIVGFAAALYKAQKMRTKESERLARLQLATAKLLSEKASDKVQINGSMKYRLPNNLHITVKGKDNERLMMQLDEAGIMCATGSACSASKDEPSHVLEAIGLSEDQARSSLRLTMGRQTTEQDISYFLDTLQKLV